MKYETSITVTYGGKMRHLPVHPDDVFSESSEVYAIPSGTKIEVAEGETRDVNHVRFVVDGKVVAGVTHASNLSEEFGIFKDYKGVWQQKE